MKMDQNSLSQLREHVRWMDTEELREAYRNGDFPRSDKVTDLDRRYRWDLFYRIPTFIRFHVVEELDSSHIDTALRKLIRPL
jgi:hypothetical protein